MNQSPTAIAARLEMKRKALKYLQEQLSNDPPESQVMRLLDLQVEVKRLEEQVK